MERHKWKPQVASVAQWTCELLLCNGAGTGNGKRTWNRVELVFWHLATCDRRPAQRPPPPPAQHLAAMHIMLSSRRPF